MYAFVLLGPCRLLDYLEAEGSSNPRPCSVAHEPLLDTLSSLLINFLCFPFSDREEYLVMAGVIDEAPPGDGMDRACGILIIHVHSV